MGLCIVILLMIISFKLCIFLLKIFGRLFGSIFGVIGYGLLALMAVTVLGLTFIAIPIIMVVGLIIIAGIASNN